MAREIVNGEGGGAFAGDGSGVRTLTRGSLSCEEMAVSRALEKGMSVWFWDGL